MGYRSRKKKWEEKGNEFKGGLIGRDRSCGKGRDRTCGKGEDRRILRKGHKRE